MAPHYIIVASEMRFRVLERFARPGQMNATLREIVARDFAPMAAHAAGSPTGYQAAGRASTAAPMGNLPLDGDQIRAADWLAEQIERFLMEHPGQAWAFAASAPLHHAVLQRLRPSVRGSLVESVQRNLTHVAASELATHFKVRV